MLDPSASIPRRSALARLATVAVLAGAVLLAHGAGLGNGFAWDDGVIIVDNPDTRVPSRIGKVALSPDVRAPYYRPLNRASYLLDHLAFGMNPAGFHAVNLALHLACVLLLYALARRLSLGRAGAITASLLLAVHPIGVEAVGFITARNNLLALLFSLSAALIFLSAERRDSGWMAGLSALAFFLGLGSKEPAAMVLPLLAGILWLPELRSRPPSWARLRLLAPHLLALLAYLALRAHALGGLGAGASATGALAGGLAHRLALNYYAIPRYLLLIAYPADLTVYHVLPEAPLGSLVWPAVVWLGLVAVVAILLRHRTAATTFGLAWFLLGIVPISNLFSLPTSTIIAERYFFIPAVGLWILLGAGVDRAWRTRGARTPIVVLGVLVVGLLTARAHARTLDWKDDLSLDRAAVAVEPRSAAAHLNLGSSLQAHGDVAGAWRHWEEAARLAPKDPGAWAAMGLQAQREGDGRRAEGLLLTALRHDPSHVEALVALGNLRDEAGDSEAARRAWEAALEANPRHAVVQVQLGTYWARRGDLVAAERLFRGALAIDPGLPEALFDLGKLCEQTGRPLDAQRYYQAFLAAPGLDPGAARVADERLRALRRAGP